jgi:hypothetical protein
MPWNLIILPLLGGFVFLDWCYYSRLRQQRIDGNRLLLESAFLGVFLVGFASALIAAFRHSRIGDFVEHGWSALLPPSDDHFKYAGTAFVALLLGLVFAFAINFIVDRRKQLPTVAAYAADQAGDYVLGLVFKSVREKRFLTILMANRMVYIGYVSVSPNLKPESQLALTLFGEGCMNKDTNQIEWYRFFPEWLADGKKAKNYMIVIPMRAIENIHFFEMDLDMPYGE